MSIDATKPTDTELIRNWPAYIRAIATYVNYIAAYIGGDFSRQVAEKNVSGVLVTSDLNKVITVNSAAAVTLILPEVLNADEGKWVRFHKLYSGDLTITPGGSDTLASGDPGQGMINSTAGEAKAAFIEFEVSNSGQWVTCGMFGTWELV